MNRQSLFVGIIILSACCAPEVWSDHSPKAMAGQVADNADRVNPAPVFSDSHSLSTEQAYQIQTMAVKRRLGNISPAGFKAGLTSNSSQQKFGVTSAVAGVLMPGGLIAAEEDRFVVSSQTYNTLMMEAELGFRLNVAVKQPITDIASLKLMVAKVLPVVELPDLSFDKPDLLKGVDIIANNVVAKRYITGVEILLAGQDLNDLGIEVHKGGDLLLEGDSSDAMGDQWQALLWLVNQTVANGWEIEPGQLLITGAIGRMLPASIGFYQVSYGALGHIDFYVEE